MVETDYIYKFCKGCIFAVCGQQQDTNTPHMSAAIPMAACELGMGDSRWVLKLTIVSFMNQLGWVRVPR